jgi:hypothetical protein
VGVTATAEFLQHPARSYNVPLMSQAELLQDPARYCEILRDPATSCGSRQLVGGVVGVTATVELYEVLRRPTRSCEVLLISQT